MTNREVLVETTFDLDDNMGQIYSQVEILFGAKDLLLDVENVLGEALVNGDSLIPITSINRKLIAIHELIRFSLETIHAACEKAQENKEVLFNHIVKENAKEVVK